MLCACSAKVFSLLIPEAVVIEGMGGLHSSPPHLPPSRRNKELRSKCAYVSGLICKAENLFSSNLLQKSENIHCNIAWILGSYPGPKAVIC